MCVRVFLLIILIYLAESPSNFQKPLTQCPTFEALSLSPPFLQPARPLGWALGWSVSFNMVKPWFAWCGSRSGGSTFHVAKPKNIGFAKRLQPHFIKSCGFYRGFDEIPEKYETSPRDYQISGIVHLGFLRYLESDAEPAEFGGTFRAKQVLPKVNSLLWTIDTL